MMFMKNHCHRHRLNKMDKMLIAGLIGFSFIKGYCIGMYLSDK